VMGMMESATSRSCTGRRRRCGRKSRESEVRPARRMQVSGIYKHGDADLTVAQDEPHILGAPADARGGGCLPANPLQDSDSYGAEPTASGHSSR
jgi:hypothetical protein